MTTTPCCAEQTITSSDETLSPDELQRALVETWQMLQDTPSYVDQQIAQSRGFLESIASQR